MEMISAIQEPPIPHTCIRTWDIDIRTFDCETGEVLAEAEDVRDLWQRSDPGALRAGWKAVGRFNFT
jgi:hypothetical protein